MQGSAVVAMLCRTNNSPRGVFGACGRQRNFAHAALAATLLCSGCMHAESSPQNASPTEITIDSQRCEGAGYNPGTDAFVNCLMSLGLDRGTATRASSQNAGN